jgi:UDP-N-acetylglucosamine 2-epimerase (hydrolysing)
MTTPATRHRILFLTGTRADFGKLKPLIRQVAANRAFEYQIFATGMHMLSRYGTTITEIHRSGFERVYPYVNQDGSVSTQMDLVLANTVQGLGHFLREYPQDLIVVHGDRVETLAGAIVGALGNTLVAHVEGGELSGTVDELIRHAVSKLCHLHFVANEEARARLVQMGETRDSVFVIGSPDIDVMRSDTLPSLDQVKERYGIPFSQYAVLIYHPVTTELSRLEDHVANVVAAAEASGRNFVVIYPNNDTGAEVIFRALLSLEGHPRFRLLPSMRFEYFLTLLKHADALVGNSSSGVREAPVYGVPSVNVGTRQLNRYRYPSILNVPDNAAAIVDALSHLPQAVPPSLDFGVGQSASLFVACLEDHRVWQTPRQKQFRDLVPRPTGAGRVAQEEKVPVRAAVGGP